MKQAEAITKMLSGANIFLTGEPGAGKTYTLNQFIEQAREAGKRIAITASTGIAASHINGQTIHSWSGLGIKDSISDYEIERMSFRPQFVEKYNACDILIIDEISMLHGSRLDMLNRMCQWMRRNSKPFGGLQVIFVGDLFQLPPVTRGSSKIDYVHLSEAWADAAPQTCYLTEQHRQGAGDELLDLLRAMRNNSLTTAQHNVLDRRRGFTPDDTITRLYTHNVDVDHLNRQRLNKIDGQIHTYEMKSSGDDRRVQTMKRSLLAPEQLELKVDAEVMFVANNWDEGFVNGTRGKVVRFSEGNPIVETSDGGRIWVQRHTWRAYDDAGRNIVAEVSQFPLRLAWAVTIHKSQGMSLDAAEIDLSHAFTPGMGYVALSRVRSLGGLYLADLGPQALDMDQDIAKFDQLLKQHKTIDSL